MISISVTIVREGNLSAEGGLAFDILAISCQASPLLLRGIPKPTAALTLARSGTGSEAARKPADEKYRLQARSNGKGIPSQVCRVDSLLEIKLL